MVKLGCSFSGKPGKDPGDQDGATTDSVPLISPLDVSQLQPPFPDQVVIKTQTEYQLSSPDQPKKFPDLEAQKLTCSHPEEGRRLPTARMIAFAMALLGCVLIMYKAIWYDQFTCPDGFLLRVRLHRPGHRLLLHLESPWLLSEAAGATFTLCSRLGLVLNCRPLHSPAQVCRVDL
nr:PREDICTED: neuron-specific vesicular protein calcyon [Equus przewalskii]